MRGERVVALVQARMSSTRLPGKVLATVSDKSLIEILFKRLARCECIDQTVLVTSTNLENNSLVKCIESLGFSVFRGSEEDVLDRYYHAALAFDADVVVRITGDCPIIDPEVVDLVINNYHDSIADYVSNVDPPTWPDGLDVEVFSLSLLRVAQDQASKREDREHVTLFMRSSDQVVKDNVVNRVDLSNMRWTVDLPEDLNVIRGIVEHFYPSIEFGWEDVFKLSQKQPEIFAINKDLKCNLGENMSEGTKLWERAKRLIPGGNMLLSKRPEMFLPSRWPSYFSKAKGCEVWDLDGIRYTDMSLMGLGTNILGYGNPDVDNAVREAVDSGNMSTLNCPEEVYLGERLVELHSWSEMVRFARTGGEANTIATRIGRAASGKDKVAICGYHGWHDWYLAANLETTGNLAEHLLPGLDPNGVPKGLRGTVLPFRYNQFKELELLVNRHPDIGVIQMEVRRSEEPQSGFLEKIRKLTTDNGIVLIFDECTSGFRQTFGGLHMQYGVKPDIATFGKALGNGYGVTAVIGRREIMEVAQLSFISSTFWTERIGSVAGLKTLEIMEREKSWERITELGCKIKDRWTNLGEKHGLDIHTNGLPALATFKIPGNNWLKYKTYITQEMLKANFLAADSIYLCICHSDAIIDEYFERLDPIFDIISACEAGKSIDELLEGPVCHSGFRRLN